MGGAHVYRFYSPSPMVASPASKQDYTKKTQRLYEVKKELEGHAKQTAELPPVSTMLPGIKKSAFKDKDWWK